MSGRAASPPPVFRNPPFRLSASRMRRSTSGGGSLGVKERGVGGNNDERTGQGACRVCRGRPGLGRDMTGAWKCARDERNEV